MIERLDMNSDYSAVETAIHMARYGIALNYCKNKKILDVACGEGYGSYYLAKSGAKEVVGIDICEDVIKKADVNFKADNLVYKVGNAEKLKGIESNYFDLIVSFETFEHVDDYNLFLKEVKRVATKNAIIIMSCPYDEFYYPNADEFNPFHKRKYSFNEFKDITENVFGTGNFLMGYPIKGYVNYIAGEEKKHQQKDFDKLVIKQDNNLLISNENLCNTEVGLYYIGVWGTKDIKYNLAAYPIKLKEYYNREKEEYYNKLESDYNSRKNEITAKALQMLQVENEELKLINSMKEERIKELESKSFKNSLFYRGCRKIYRKIKR